MSARKPVFGVLRLVLLALSIVPKPVVAQSVTVPALHHRGEPAPRHPQVTASHGRGSSGLPEDASGEYTLGEAGELIQIILQSGRLDGYVSRLGDTESDEGAPLTFFFDHTSLHAERLSFTTWQVHGVWFTFEGTIVRGPARSRTEDGYYLLEGELVEHNQVQHAQQRNRVSLKLSHDSGSN
jgi:hypothetical protein